MRSSRTAIVAALVALALPVSGCRPELVLRLTTRVFGDGGIERRVDLTGRTAEREAPKRASWFADELGLALAAPEAWGRIERALGQLRAEGYFAAVELLPPLFVYERNGARRFDRHRTELEIEERVVLRRYTYRELHGDPYDEAESLGAIDALVDLLARGIGAELGRHFGPEFDGAPAESFVRAEGRDLATALYRAQRAAPGIERLERRNAAFAESLASFGIAAVAADPTEFWEAQLPRVSEWLRAGVAASVSSPVRTIAPADLTFWPAPDDFEADALALIERAWGSEERFGEAVGPHFDSLVGWFGGDSGPRQRFEIRVQLPGTLLATNGTPDGDGAWWILREDDLSAGEQVLSAVSAELLLEPLRALGGRRDFERSELARLADLLYDRDPDGTLAQALRLAVAAGNVKPLVDDPDLPEDIKPLAHELAELLLEVSPKG